MSRCLCGASDTSFFGQRNGGTVARCVACGLLRRINYDPDDILWLYTAGTEYHDRLQREIGHMPYHERYYHDLAVAQSRWPKLTEAASGVPGLVGTHPLYPLAGRRLVDVGCANGAFVAYAADRLAVSYGVEINPIMAKFAQGITGRPVATAWEAARQWGIFDIVTYHDVIEHLVDPVGEMARVHQYTTQNPLLVVDTPDTDDPRFTTLGTEWHHFRPEQHLWYFNEFSLRDCLRRAGWTTIGVDRPIPGKVVLYATRFV